MKKRIFLVLGGLLLIGFPVFVRAQGASKQFLNTAECPSAANKMNVPPGTSPGRTMDIKVAFGPPEGSGGGNGRVEALNIGLTMCDPAVIGDTNPGSGATVARLTVQAICNACLSAGGKVDGKDGSGTFCGVPPQPACNCNFVRPAPDQNKSDPDLNCKVPIGGNQISGFNFDKASLGIRVGFDPLPPPNESRIIAVSSNTNAGNKIGSDILPSALIRVDPAGQTGPILFEFDDGTMGPLATFTVNSTGQTSQQLHDEIRDQLIGLGFSAETTTDTRFSCFPADFQGPFVRVHDITKGNTIIQYNIDAIDGMKNLTENNDFSGILSKVPALSTWGVIVLIALLLLSTTWLLRRRARIQGND